MGQGFTQHNSSVLYVTGLYRVAEIMIPLLVMILIVVLSHKITVLVYETQSNIC